jgi:two-component system NtrC family sensor kinase
MSSGLAKLVGREPSDLVGKPLASLFATGAATLEPHAVAARHAHRITLDATLAVGPGRTAAVRVSAKPVRDQQGTLTELVCVYADQSTLREAEETLREAQAIQATLLEGIQEGALFVVDDRVRFANASAARILGYDRHESLAGQHTSDLIHPGELHLLMQDLADTASDHTAHQRRVTVHRPDGGRPTVDCTSTYVAQPSGHGMLCIFTDVSEQQHTAQALSESESLYLAVIESLTDGVLIASGRKRLVANRAYLDILGVESIEALERVPKERRIHPDDMPRVLRRLRPLEGGGHEPGIFVYRIRHQPTGAWRTIERRVVPVTFKGEAARLVIIRDVTHQGAFEDHVRNLQKMESVGQLAAGVAHEVNNPLTVINGLAKLLAAGPISQEQRQGIEAISTQAERALKVVRELLSFARRSGSTRTPTQLEAVVDQVLQLKAYDLTSNRITVRRSPPPHPLPPVMADENQLHQVLLNIVTNAQQAIAFAETPGTLTVSVSEAPGVVRAAIHNDGPPYPAPI